MDWFLENSARYNLSAYAGEPCQPRRCATMLLLAHPAPAPAGLLFPLGVVGVDHYWTGQGVPCGSDGPSSTTGLIYKLTPKLE